MFAAISSILHIPYTWAVKLVLLGVILAVWVLVVGSNSQAMIDIINYGLNLTLYRVLPESSVVTIEQAIFLPLSWGFFRWITDHNTHASPGG